MKIFGKEEQRKIDLQIKALQEQLAVLQAELKQSLAATQRAESATDKATADGKVQADKLRESVKALEQEVDRLNNKLVLAKEESGTALLKWQEKAKQEAEAATQKATAQANAQLDAKTKELADAKAQLEAKTKELDTKAKELAAAQAATTAATKAKQDGDAASAKALAEAKAQTDGKAKELDAKAKELADSKAQLDAKAKELAAAQAATAAATKAKQDGDAASAKALAEAKAQTDGKAKELDAKAKELADAKAQLDAKAKELDAKTKELTAAQAATAAATKAKQDGDAANAKELADTKAQLDKLKKEQQQHKAKLEDTTQENELLLLQLMQAQEELVEYYEQKGQFEKLYQAYKSRWDRLESRYPNYIDFGGLELVAFDHLSEVPSITWRVKDYAQGGVAFDEFLFQTVLQDGHPGIGLLADAQATASADSALVPMLVKSSAAQLAVYTQFGHTQFRQLAAATTILAQLESSGWKGVDLPTAFDAAFWRPSLKLLPAQLQALPAVLRYDAVKLKRELVNPDYEHLWLEFKGLALGARTWPKFEIRLGAALVQPEGFSQFPKFEVPLIDGKTKPFDSWYAESHDDSGAKLELRFALEKKAFDTSVWAKLEDLDKALLLRLVYAMPEALKRLEAEHAAIHRPWATWVNFAEAAVQVIEANRALAKAAAKEAAQAQTSPLLAPAKALPAPAAEATSVAITAVNSARSKVISIGSKKPVAKKAATPANKLVPSKPATSKAVPAKKTSKTKQ